METTKTVRLYAPEDYVRLGDVREFIQSLADAPADALIEAGLEDAGGAVQIDVVRITWMVAS